MKIVIATGIYPPEIGGPALYAQGVSESLQKSGHTVALAVFTPYKKYPSGIRHLLYMFDLARCAWRADVIVAFDTASVGVPSACVGMLLRMPVVVRVGGDFLWEQYVERTHQLIPLPHLYTAVRTFSFKENIIRASTKFLARHTQLAFNTQWLADIWQAPYALESSRVHIIENIIGERVQTETPTQKNILLYGRPIVIKNVPAFSRAFEVAHSDISDIVLVSHCAWLCSCTPLDL
jgi:glycosyltransferase involved in cell wall biosynthesis